MMYRLGEFHAFEGGGRKFIYLVPSAGIFELDPPSSAVLDRLSQGGATHAELAAIADEEAIEELRESHAIVTAEIHQPVQQPPADFPLQTLVMNLTNQCNLSCQYCYEFGEDKVATPEGKPKFMDFETASRVRRLSVHAVGRTPRRFTLRFSAARR